MHFFSKNFGLIFKLELIWTFLISNFLQSENQNVIPGWKIGCHWNFNKASVWFRVYQVEIFCVIAWKRHPKIKSVEEKFWKVLRDLENSISNKDAFEKYGVLKKTVSAWLKNNENFFSGLEKSSTHPKQKIMH